MAAKNKAPIQKPDPIGDSPEVAMNLLYQAEAESLATMFKNEEVEQEEQSKLAREVTKTEMKELMDITDAADSVATWLMNSKPKKGSKK